MLISSLALGLVISSAFIHATWNLFAKRAGGGAAFVWLFSVATTLLYAPVAAFIYYQSHPELGVLAFVFIFGTALLHITYFVTLQRAYSLGDLSLIYPLARGTGPFLSTLLAILIFKERPTALALAGAALIVFSVFLLAGGTRLFQAGQSLKTRTAIRYGLIIGLVIAIYTLWDSYAVAVLLIPPIIFDWASNLLRSVALTPNAIKNWAQVKQHWQNHKLELFMVALLSPLSYILVLTALSFSPVSYIAPARELSILIGAIMGASLLKEADAKRRLFAAFLIVLGVIFLALG